ncbi:PREDICTED: uncharacterized protein LOC104823548 [Tarenaya hassleriana]|uniref:uncharacterized protein LOC104823548 n=1 Tax=Tarenaya hassleriana TaxID=28532 RepID=UPI00053C86D3|nr:PREDICTED: uncharacterized protein LOC104823548 [Tarenaya hassleriana]
MYFHGLCKDNVLLQNGIRLKPENERVDSYLETSKQKPVGMVTLFGRQVFPVQSGSYESVDEQPCRDLNRDIIDLGSHGCPGVTAEIELSMGVEVIEKEASIPKWLSKRNPVFVIDLEEPPSRLSLKEMEPSASGVGRVLESQPSVDDDGTCYRNPGLSDEGHMSGNTEKAMKKKNTPSSKQSFVLDLNEIPADEPYPDGHRYFLQDLNCYPYTDDTTPSSEKSGVEDPTPFCSPLSQNVLDKDSTSSPASYTSCCTTENDSRVESRSSCPATLIPSCRARLEYPETEALPSKPTNESHNEEDSSEMSSCIQFAAESLVHISCNSSYRHQDLLSKPEQRPICSSQDRDFSSKPDLGNAAPEYSYDSYELMTMELTETSPEDYCVSSKAVDELNVTGESKELGLKLRRGRRMKNFQKEILPGLVSLSRHEIREDINILEAVLRSREYKKMQGKTGDEKCEANPRKRRSGQRYVGRRRRRSE